MFSSNGSGDRSSTKKSIFTPTRRLPTRGQGLPATSTSIIVNAHTRASTNKRQMRHTISSLRCRQHNRRRHPLMFADPVSSITEPPLIEKPRHLYHGGVSAEGL